jgi:hypothetical protein
MPSHVTVFKRAAFAAGFMLGILALAAVWDDHQQHAHLARLAAERRLIDSSRLDRAGKCCELAPCPDVRR